MSHQMSDFRTILAALRRPRLLMRAARFGLSDYRRERDLRRLIAALPGPEAAVRDLLDAEADLERTRQAGAAGYSAARHIEVLIALMAEAGALVRREIAPDHRQLAP